MPRSHYTSVLVPIPGWKLLTKRPRVLVAQLTLRFRAPSPQRGIIKLVADEDYVRRLRSTVDQIKERGAHFLVFPEYAWPFEGHADSIAYVSGALPKMGACVMPFEHLSFDEFHRLLRALPMEKEHRAAVLRDVRGNLSRAERDTCVVNVCAVLVRTKNAVRAFVQPKTQPAGLEEPRHLGTKFAGGRKRYVLQDDHGLKVAVAICFDLIARDDAVDEHPREAMAEPPTLLFVPECNPSPLHDSYARAVVDLYEQPRWAAGQSVIVFANAAAGSELRGLKQATHFGFSRCVGSLGSTSPAMRDVFLVREGIIVHQAPLSLAKVDVEAEVVRMPVFSWVIARPEQSLISIDVPPIDRRPDHDPTRGRTHTEVHLLRWARGTSARWQEIRAALAPVEEGRHVGIPVEHIADLVQAQSSCEQFLTLLHTSPRPVWLFADGGTGKTATVATALHDAVEKPGMARVVWQDVGGLPKRPEALAEALLERLGLVGALKESPTEQWGLLAEHLRSRPTVLVIDSFEKWGCEELPRPILDLHGWPTRVVVTARLEGSADVESMAIPPLSREGRLELLRRVPGIENVGDIDTLAAALGSTPLSIVWFTGLVKTSPALAVQMAANVDEGASDQMIFDWCVRELTDVEAEVLSVLHELPSPISADDLGAIIGGEDGEIKAAVRRLGQLNLVFVAHGELHARHPYVRQFWERSPGARLSAVRSKLRLWADSLLDTHGGDRKWEGHKVLAPKWGNLRAVMMLVRADATEAAQRAFLRMWRRVDYFLWSSGHLRDRLELGRAAAEIARDIDDRPSLAHALFDSIAETLWHRDGSIEECSRHLDEAENIFIRLGDLRGRALVACYRSRLFRAHRKWEEAQYHAIVAVRLAKRSADQHTLGFVLNAHGNVCRDRQRRANARTSYRAAARRFRQTDDREMQAVVDRNLGRCALDTEDYSDALERLERAMGQLRDLGLRVEEAEAGMYRAKALLRLGERDEALSQLEIARSLFEAVGALGRLRIVQEIRNEAR
jgi:predicted amidohydrolase/tetratricopeptide (TPR) repeat protein